MKQTVRRAAIEGMHEYKTDDTAILCDAQMQTRRAAQMAHDHYYQEAFKELDEQVAAERRMMLNGINPVTVMSFTAVEFQQIIATMDLTLEERSLAFNHLTMMQDFEQDSIEFEEQLAWSQHASSGNAFHDDCDDASALTAIGNDNLSSMIESDLLTPPRLTQERYWLGI